MIDNTAIKMAASLFYTLLNTWKGNQECQYTGLYKVAKID